MRDQHSEILDLAPHQGSSALKAWLDRAKLIRSPRRFLSALSKRFLRLRIMRRVRRLWWVLRTRANDGVCSVEINTQFGFFAHLTWCLYGFVYCDRRGLIPDFRLTGNSYSDDTRGPNWLHHYFDMNRPITCEEIVKRVRYTKRIFDSEDVEQLTDLVEIKISLDDGIRALNKYLSVKPHINELVAGVWERSGFTGPVLGVHFRGTDKHWEAPRVSWDHCLSLVHRQLHEHDTLQGVFVASDEQKFVDFVKNSIRQIPVYSHDDHHRSIDGRAVHTDDEIGGYEKGQDALMNALLLAKCSILIRTTSTLSAWALLFNPNIKVILLNKPYRNNLWYPESEIIKKHDTEYIPDALAPDRL